MNNKSLAERLYGGIRHRSSVDLDILVQLSDVAGARNVLIESGFQDVSRNQRMFHLEFSRLTKSGVNVHVELHRRLIGYAMDGDHLAYGIAGSRGLTEHCWKRTARCAEHWQMRPAVELLYLCLHLTEHLMIERGVASSGVMCSSLMLARDIQLAID
ncbi:MAG: nucleotidyltransferase family protein [Pseudomonadota bacterium]